jgi:hypothetical protein
MDMRLASIQTVSHVGGREARDLRARPCGAAGGHAASWSRVGIGAACIGLLLGGAVGGQSPVAWRHGQLLPTARPGTLILRVGLERVAETEATAVPLDHVFESGDHFRINITVNRAGYLRLLHRGVGGKFERLWPPGSQPVPIGPNEAVLVPDKGSILLDEKAGTEMIQVVFSVDPLEGPQAGAPRTGAGSEGAPAKIGQIRLRDLVVEHQGAEADLGRYFTGELGEHGVSTLAFELRHQARR